MADMMTFPDTVEEFMEEYKLVDTEQVYTNGTELIPIFRMKQWFEHEKAQLSKEDATSDLISRQQAIDALDCINGTEEVLRSLPSAQPEYEEVTPEKVASEIASGSIKSAWSWLNVIIQLKQMGYAICRKR